MRRELIVNWSSAHEAIRQEIEKPRPQILDVGDSGKGWTYMTFFAPGTPRDQVLFDLERLHSTALENGFFLPRDLITQHNKIVVSAYSALGSNPSYQLFGLYHLVERFAMKFDSIRKYPNHGFYGKMGGVYDRVEKGRVVCIYAQSDDSLLTIVETLDELMKKSKLTGVVYDYHLANGLSDIPRLMDHFDDPDYLAAGATHCRITDPSRFTTLVEQARLDYSNYLFNRAA